MDKRDIVIVGGGIVGLATAYRLLQQYPQWNCLILEKEPELACHQTGRNSGVLHTGVYYKPGSYKALNCRAGKDAMQAFCTEHGIPFDICGKVIVALSENEMPALNRIYERGQANGVHCEIIDRPRLLEIEPHVAGIKAIHVPNAGIVDYTLVAQKMAQLVRGLGGKIQLNTKVLGIQENANGVVVETTQGEFTGDLLVNCAGLYSDKLAKMTTSGIDTQIVPFRGEYFELSPEAEPLCRTLIYPVPDPRFPFLGVHFTRTIAGGVECGPNAVLAFAREGYYKSDINLKELVEAVTYPGFLRIMQKHWYTGMGEMWRSVNKGAFVKALQRLVPAIKAEHLSPIPAGIRAQAITRDGALFDDFAFVNSKRAVHVVNAPSPGATSSLSIGNTILEKIVAHLDAG